MVLAIAFAGVGFIKLPPFITYDGLSHYYRALQIARGTMRPTIYSATAVGGELPVRYKAYGERLWSMYWSRHTLGSLDTWREVSHEPTGLGQMARVEFTNTAIYSPLNYAGAAVGIAVATRFSASPFVAERAAVMANFGLYCWLVVLAIEALPVFRGGALLIASSPLIMFQALSVSSDGLNLALPLMCFATVIGLRHSGLVPAKGMILAVCLLCVLLALLKPTAVVLMGFLGLLPASYLGGRLQKARLLFGCLALGALVWWWWNRLYLETEIARWFFPDHYPASKMKAWFLQQPSRFAWPLYRALTREWWQAWPSGYTYVGGWVPAEIYEKQMIPLHLFQCCLFLGGGWVGKTDRELAVVTLAISLGLFALVALTLWLSYGYESIDHIPYLAGRYLLIVYFGAAFAVSALTHNFLPALRSKLVWPGLAANVIWIVYVMSSIKS
jgi:hypothetical protein